MEKFKHNLDELKNSQFKIAVIDAYLGLYDPKLVTDIEDNLSPKSETCFNNLMLILDKLNYSLSTIQNYTPTKQESPSDDKPYTFFNLNNHGYILADSLVLENPIILIRTEMLLLQLIEEVVLNVNQLKSEDEIFINICDHVNELAFESVNNFDSISQITRSRSNYIDLFKKLKSSAAESFPSLKSTAWNHLEVLSNKALAKLMGQGDDSDLIKLIELNPDFFLQDIDGNDICSSKQLCDSLIKFVYRNLEGNFVVKENKKNKSKFKPKEYESIKTSFLYLISWLKKYKISPKSTSLIKIIRPQDHTLEFQDGVKSVLRIYLYLAALVDFMSEKTSFKERFPNLVELFLKIATEVEEKSMQEIVELPNTIIKKFRDLTNSIINKELAPSINPDFDLQYLNNLYYSTDNYLQYPKSVWNEIYTELFRFYAINTIALISNDMLIEIPSHKEVFKYYKKINQVNNEILKLYQEFNLVYEAQHILFVMIRYNDIQSKEVVDFMDKISSPDFNEDDFLYCGDLLYEIRKQWKIKTTSRQQIYSYPDK